MPENAGLDAADAVFVVGYDATANDEPDPRLPLVTRLGEALLASGTPWRIRRLVPGSGERDVPTRSNVRREIDGVLARPAAARLLIVCANVTRTLEGIALVCAPSLDGFREDATVALDWLASRLRRASDVPTAVVVAASGPHDAAACLDALGTTAAAQVIAVDVGAPIATLRAMLDGLWGEATDLATGTVTPRALASYLGRRLARATIQPSSSTDTLLAPRGLARTDLGERLAQGRDEVLDELAGAVLPGRFCIVGELGRGGFGVVYRAHHELIDRDVAIKVLAVRLGPEAMRRFALEIRAVGRLDHRNVVRVLHADVMRDGRLFVAMELLDGPTLEAALVSGPLGPVRAEPLVRQLIAGLAAAHEAGVIHGDVKPANLIVVEDDGPRLVLLDFGLARLASDPATSAPGGTAAFMAPEQLRGERGDASADLYAAALVAVALVAGAACGPADRATAIARFEDERLRAALARCLADEPVARFPSAVELAAAIDSAERVIAAPPVRPPFRIAAPFSEEDHGDFHGRAGDIERLLEHVLFRRAVVYVAPSGTGKTSLLRAGLVPRLRELDVDAAYVMCRGGVASDVAAALGAAGGSVAATITHRLAASPTRRLVLIIDQIEAALTDARDATHGGAVLETLGMTDWPVDAPVGVVWSVREEYLARLLDRVQRIEPGVPIVRLGPLAPEVAGEVLTRTLERRGVEIEPALVRALIGDLTAAAATLATELGWGDSRAVYPPHLQLAGAVLYEARAGRAIDVALYQRVGGLATILSEHLHHVLEGELGEADTAIARDVLLALVSASRTRMACEHSELIARVTRHAPARTAPAVVVVLEFLRDRGLLVAAPGGREPVWDLAHDSLVARVEAWVTATDLARLRALELVRYHLRRSTPELPSRLGAAELREIRDHLGPADLADLDNEWRVRRPGAAAPASRLIAASRRAVRRRRGELGAFALVAVAVAGGFALRWRDGQREIALRDRDIGDSELVLRAFDWDPVRFRATDTTAVGLTWELRRPLPDDDDLPGPPLPPDDLSSHPLPPPAGAVRRDAIAARGGPAVLVVARRDRAGRSCSPVVVPIRKLPGHGQHRTLGLRIPTCEATLAGMIAVPAGPFISGGVGEPQSPDQQRYHLEERVVVLPDYWLDRTEVPNGLLTAVSGTLQLGERALPIYPAAEEYAHAGEASYPVTSLTWAEAMAVCRLLGKRLPSSAEWQKALRGGLAVGEPPAANPTPRRNLPWGVALEAKRSNINHGGGVAPAAVGASPGDIGPYGHLDLAGNVSEWTSDRSPDGFVVLRGGNWAETTPGKLVDFNAIENPRPPKASMYTFGFRCAADAVSPYPGEPVYPAAGAGHSDSI